MLVATSAGMNSNAALLLWQTAHRSGARPAIVEQGGTLDYAGLQRRAAGVAAALLAAGVGPNTPVAIFLERGSDAAAAFFGTLAVGGIAVFVNETLRPRQIDHILGHSGARHMLTTAELLARQPRALEEGPQILDVAAIAASQDEAIAPVPRLRDDVAQIIYTSGSTGQPKGVTVTHANVEAAARTVVAYLGITCPDRIASLLPFSFVYGLSQLLCAVTAGAALVVERSPLPQQIVAALRDRQITVLAAVPAWWLRLLSAGGLRDTALPALRIMTNAGGHLPLEVVRGLRAAQPHARLFLMYGLTEALRSTYLPPEEVDRRPDSIGRAIPGAEIFVMRDDGTAAAPGEVGELVQRGPTVTLGYWKDPQLTARVFRPHPQRPEGAPDAERVVYSGDLVRRDADGFLYFVSRKDRIIKTMGFRVGPDEIADVLLASGEVAEAAVMGEPDAQWGERIVAHVVLSVGGSVDRLKAYCGRELPRHLQPARFEVREAMPLLPSGKHDVAALRA